MSSGLLSASKKWFPHAAIWTLIVGLAIYLSLTLPESSGQYAAASEKTVTAAEPATPLFFLLVALVFPAIFYSLSEWFDEDSQ